MVSPVPAALEINNTQRSKQWRWQFLLLLAITVGVWFLLRGWGSDPDGLNYALNMETGDPARFLGADHLLWHVLVGAVWVMAKLVDTAIRPVPVQQLVNLIMFGVALYLFCRYLNLKGKSWWWAGLGLLLSFASLRAMAGEHVDSGTILATVILCFILPGSPKEPRLWLQPLLLAIFPWLHKSLIVFFPGYFLAYLCLATDKYPKRLLKPLLVIIVATVIALSGFAKVWLLFIGDRIPFGTWLASYVGKTTGFWADSLGAVLTGIPISIYRMFLSLSPYKAWQMGSPLGLVGLGLSGLVVVALLVLTARTIWRGKNATLEANYRTETLGILLAIAPSVIFFCFWMPGMYYFWSRFLPAFWLILALRQTQRGLTKYLAWLAVALLLLVNIPSLYCAKDGEEAGRFTRWVGQTTQKGDLVLLSGGGALFDGKMLAYHNGVETITLEYLSRLEGSPNWLKAQVEKTVNSGGHVWLVEDRGRFSSNRLISGEITSTNKGLEILKTICIVGEKKQFADPGFENAGISACQLR